MYTVAVCSLLTYGCESWTLSDKVMRMINGANSQMLSRITGHNVMQEARRATTSYDILTHIRRMILTWLGKILISNPNSMLFKAVEMQRDMVEMQGDMSMTGNLLMDAPFHQNLEELRFYAIDKAFWNEQIKNI